MTPPDSHFARLGARNVRGLSVFVAIFVLGCGGSSAETPWPAEPDDVDLEPTPDEPMPAANPAPEPGVTPPPPADPQPSPDAPSF